MLKKTSLGFLLIVALLAPSVQAQDWPIEGRLAFASNRSGSWNIWILDLDTNELAQLTDFQGEMAFGYISFIQWSKSAKQILFAGLRDRYNVYLINSDGTGLRQLTNYPGGHTEYCAWDPIDDNAIYCEHQLYWGGLEYYRINLLTNEETRFGPSPDFYENGACGDDYFDITPDGQALLFSRDIHYGCSYIGYQDLEGNLLSIIRPYEAGRLAIGRINKVDEWFLIAQAPGFPGFPPFNIFKINKEGTIKVQLTNSTGNVENIRPSWTEGGNTGYILFHSNMTGNSEIMLMKADGLSFPEGVINLTNNPASDEWPGWTPVGSYLTVEINIRPESETNPINLGSNGSLPVAILGSAEFDASQVDPMSVTLAGAYVRLRGKGTPMAEFIDINNDGYGDLVVNVDTTALELSPLDTQAILEGKTFSGKRIRGTDTVIIVAK